MICTLPYKVIGCVIYSFFQQTPLSVSFELTSLLNAWDGAVSKAQRKNLVGEVDQNQIKNNFRYYKRDGNKIKQGTEIGEEG